MWRDETKIKENQREREWIVADWLVDVGVSNGSSGGDSFIEMWRDEPEIQ